MSSLAEQQAHILRGDVYDDTTPELVAARARAVSVTDCYHQSVGRPADERLAILRSLLREVGDGAFLEPHFRCEFGYNITVGRSFYANFDAVMLDGASITIGHDVLFGPRVSLYTSNHAIDPGERAAGACYARPISIADNVWVGGGVTINPGVRIGAGSVIGAGAVVTSDIPDHVVAVGVPCRVLRPITAADRTGYRPDAR